MPATYQHWPFIPMPMANPRCRRTLGSAFTPDLPNQFCGKQGVRWNPPELPRIGCFGLSSGSSASATIGNHRLEVAVGSTGTEICKIDGAIVGCNGCVYKDDVACETRLDLISRNNDKSIFFYFGRRTRHGYFVTNQENWDYEETRRN